MSNQHKSQIVVNELEQHMMFQSLLAEISADFVRISCDAVDGAIQESLHRIAENLDLDLISLGLLTADGQDFYSKYQYTNNARLKPWLSSSLMSESLLNSVQNFPGSWGKKR